MNNLEAHYHNSDGNIKIGQTNELESMQGLKQTVDFAKTNSRLHTQPIDLGPLKQLPNSYKHKLFYLIDLFAQKHELKPLTYTFHPEVCELVCNTNSKKQNKKTAAKKILKTPKNLTTDIKIFKVERVNRQQLED